MFALQLLSEGGEGPNTELLWLLYIGIALFFMIIIIGWLTSNRKEEQAERGHDAPKSKKDADDLARIEGETKGGRKKQV